MDYFGMPMGMWLIFCRSFRSHLVSVMGYDASEAASISRKARCRYKEIIRKLPEFEKGDRFMANEVSCAMFAAFILSMPGHPSLEKLTEYYAMSMMTEPMKWFCRKSGRQKFSEKDIRGMKETASLRTADRNRYSWNMDFIEYEDGSGYEARFTECGICTLMNELGLSYATPALCNLDYEMSSAGGASEFIRKYTLASGGPYCDCGYRKRK